MELHEISHGYSADDNLSYEGHIFSSKWKKHAILSKKLPFFAKKSVSNFFGSESGKNEVDILNLHVF